MLPRVALEYGHTSWALATSSSAVAWSRAGAWTSSSTARPNPPLSSTPMRHAGRHLGAGDVELVAAGDQLQRRVEAGGVAGGEQLLGVGGPAGAAHLLGDAQVEVEDAVVARWRGRCARRRWRWRRRCRWLAAEDLVRSGGQVPAVCARGRPQPHRQRTEPASAVRGDLGPGPERRTRYHDSVRSVREPIRRRGSGQFRRRSGSDEDVDRRAELAARSARTSWMRWPSNCADRPWCRTAAGVEGRERLLHDGVVEARRPLAGAEAGRGRAVVDHVGDAAGVHVGVQRVDRLDDRLVGDLRVAGGRARASTSICAIIVAM